MRTRAKYALAVAAALLVAAAVSVGYAALGDTGTTVNACMMKTTGAVRIIDPALGSGSLRGHCLATEEAVSWSQQGPPGNLDSTVRHISGAVELGKTVSTPVYSAEGEIGTLSLTCRWNDGGSGDLTYKTDIGTRLIINSSKVADHIWTLSEFGYPDTVTFPWTGDDIWFEMMIENQIPSAARPGLTLIHGYELAYVSEDWSGCVYYVFMDASDMALTAETS